LGDDMVTKDRLWGGYLSTKSMPTVGRSSSPTSLAEEMLVVGHGIEWRDMGSRWMVMMLKVDSRMFLAFSRFEYAHYDGRSLLRTLIRLIMLGQPSRMCGYDDYCSWNIVCAVFPAQRLNQHQIRLPMSPSSYRRLPTQSLSPIAS
jgi:hypothetical protein